MRASFSRRWGLSVLSNEIGKPGEAGDSYIKYLEYNLDVIVNGLAE